MEAKMKKNVALALLVLMSMACALTGCKSWAPSTAETGKCAVDRHWVAPAQDPSTGEWKEGYCEWDTGKAG